MMSTIAVTGVTTSPQPLGAPLKIGDTITFTLATDLSIDSVDPVSGGSMPTLSLSNGATANYFNFDETGLHFFYTVQAGHAEDTNDLVVTGLSLNGASVNHVASFSFTPPSFAAPGSFPHSVTSADVNGDGKADLIAANNGDNTVSVLLGNGDGTFAPQATFAVGGNPVSVTSTDVNGDGKADLIVANQGSNNISVLLGNGDGTFATQATYAASNS